MKLIIAIIRPEKLPDVKEALLRAKVFKFTVSNAIGRGKEEGFMEIYRGVAHEIKLLKKVRLEIAVNDNFADRAVKAIVGAARTHGGTVGDGKIFVLDLKRCVRIRTGEEGSKAIG